MRRRSLWKSCVYATMGVGLTLLAACDKTSEPKPPETDTSAPDILAQDGSDSASTEIDAELITGSLVGGTTVDGLRLANTEATGTDLTPRALGDGAKALYFPRGCLEAANDAATSTVTYTFKTVPGAQSRGCSGPNGLRNVIGEVKAKYRSDGATLVLDLVGTNLQVNRATVDWTAHAEITANGADRTMTWKAQLDGTTPRGRSFTRTNEKVAKWRLGERCYALEGVSTGDVNKRSLRTEITGFRRCAGACPENGGKIVVVDVTKDKRVEMSFDGSRFATFTAPNGQTSQIDLFCGG
ncbi:MAG: hypothetical protein JST00_04795 [Deltaproteobacteria bacterium]|nr:hypothetical protein [Deltaproteobacteria bacterium]